MFRTNEQCELTTLLMNFILNTIYQVYSGGCCKIYSSIYLESAPNQMLSNWNTRTIR